MAAGFRLTMMQGPTPGKVFELTKDILTVGRDVSNDIVINDAEVSRHHARLTRQAGGYMIEDLSSTNGTFINNQRLIGPRPMARGDSLGLGETIALNYEVAAGTDAQATLVGAGAQGYQQPGAAPPGYVPPPAMPPAYAPPPQQQAMPQPPPPAPRSKPQSRTGLYIGIGCGCLILLLVVCGGVGWYLDANYPDILYAPLKFFGF
ncbi:MAG: FHA domain-containing protein [Chloroflexi bacterium]|nr:FHA domain-containing protein [Chloroflexota bacterium]